MEVDNLTREQLATIKSMAADAVAHAADMVQLWHSKFENPSAVSPEQSLHVARQNLDHWLTVENKWWKTEDAICARIRKLKYEEA